jgi:LSD1 subclass zinc finger protein
MPVVTCTKCPTQLRVPEGATGNVKCPKCQNIFPVNPKPSAAFEVVDEAPAKPTTAAKPAAARPAAAAAAPVARPAPPPPAPAKKSEPEEDFNFDDDAPKKKRRSDDDDDDGRDRKKRRRDDDGDEDDRSRSKRRRDDDDEDDRPRRKKKSRRDYDDDDDEDDYRRPAGKGNGFGNAKTGVLLVNISLWLYFSVLAVISFCLFLAWVGAFDGSSSSRGPRGGYDDDFGGGGGGETLVKLVGITGMANWVVGLVGLGFCIAGPARARGMAITATALAGAHLLFTGLTVNSLGGGLIGRFSGGLGGGTWICWTSMLPFIDALLPAIIYSRGGFPSELLIAFLAGACELARLIFIMLMVKQLSVAAKDYDSAEKSQIGVLAATIIAGVSAALVLVVVVLLDAGITKSFTALANIMMVTLLLVYMGFTFMTLLPALSSGGARASLARRARRG